MPIIETLPNESNSNTEYLNQFQYLLFDNKTLVVNEAIASDAMEFFTITKLPSNATNYLSFATELLNTIKNKFGGKTCVHLSSELSLEQRQTFAKIMQTVGFFDEKLSTNVVTFAANELKNAMANLQLNEKVQGHLAEIKANYKILLKNELSGRELELLALLENSGFIAAEKIWQGLYTERGMRERIQHPNTMPFALEKAGKLVACAFFFLYSKNKAGDFTKCYAHDVTLSKPLRHATAGGMPGQSHFGQAFLVECYQQVVKAHSTIDLAWLIGGGAPAFAKLREHLYKVKLPGKSVVNQAEIVEPKQYINFTAPGPELLLAGAREKQLVTISYADDHSIQLYPAKAATLTITDRERIERLETQELNARAQAKSSASSSAAAIDNFGFYATAAVITNSASQVLEDTNEKAEIAACYPQNNT